MIKLLLDTNILLGALIADRKAHISCLSILLQNNIALLTNEYVLKEARKIMEEVYSFDQEDINRFIEFLRLKWKSSRRRQKKKLRKSIQAINQTDQLYLPHKNIGAY